MTQHLTLSIPKRLLTHLIRTDLIFLHLLHLKHLKPQLCKSRSIKGGNVLTESDEVPKAPDTILRCVLLRY